jgi:hypoxanthine phosphoribosyltransferase
MNTNTLQVPQFVLTPVGQLNDVSRRSPLYIEDDLKVKLEHFYIPAHYQDTLECLLVPHGMIVDRIEKLASDIIQDYHGQTIHLLCVLKGGSTFFQDLCNALRKFHDYGRNTYIPFTFDFIRVKSYEGTESSGNVKISGCDVSKLKDKHILLVEDIIDTGTTMTRLLAYMNQEVNPASIRSFVLRLCSTANILSPEFPHYWKNAQFAATGSKQTMSDSRFPTSILLSSFTIWLYLTYS